MTSLATSEDNRILQAIKDDYLRFEQERKDRIKGFLQVAYGYCHFAKRTIPSNLLARNNFDVPMLIYGLPCKTEELVPYAKRHGLLPVISHRTGEVNVDSTVMLAAARAVEMLSWKLGYRLELIPLYTKSRRVDDVTSIYTNYDFARDKLPKDKLVAIVTAIREALGDSDKKRKPKWVYDAIREGQESYFPRCAPQREPKYHPPNSAKLEDT